MSRRSALLAAAVATALVWVVPVRADVLCKTRHGGLKVRATACKRRETPFTVPGGPIGPAGADGQLRIYGDGSAGANVIAANGALAEANPQYTDFTVSPGVTLDVSSGTVIRCTGTFTNNGTIVVSKGAFAASRIVTDTTTTDAAGREPESGVARAAASSGELGSDADQRFGGSGGEGVQSDFHARTILRPGPKAGGGGGAGTGAGGTGGGSLGILAGTAAINNGAINADAADSSNSGGGGGGGGVVILASPGSVANNGAISAKGGRGGDSNASNGAGGGGGGGIVHLLAPTVSNAGLIDVAGGSFGTVGAPGSVSGARRAGGGGGGACGGDGGPGGFVSAAGDPGTPSGPGVPGLSLQTQANPTALF